MRHLTNHGKLLALMTALLVVPAAAAALTGAGLLTDRPHEQTSDAFDRIVPGMTRADDLAGLGFDARDAVLVAPAALPLHDAAAQACIAADRFCTGYVFHPRGADVVLLVMDGRVVDKVISPRA
jgi:hypothetical protein